MGYVYFAWLLGLLVGWAFMNVLVKLHPTRFAFMMSLVVVIAWVLYYFVDIKLTNYNTKPVSEQLGQIVDVMKRHLVLFLVFYYKVLLFHCYLYYLHMLKVVGVSTIEYTIAIAIGGAGCAFQCYFYLRLLIKIVRALCMQLFYRFYTIHAFIFGLSLVTNILIVWIVAIFIGLMYGILLPAWNTFMAGQIDPRTRRNLGRI